jgi:carbon-monoxide dehydrogenase large subunit
MHSVGLKECLRKAAGAIGWGEAKPTRKRGKGIACMFKCTTAPSSSTAFVKINQDGTVGITTCTVEVGQGARTVLSQIAAEEIGVPLEAVRVSMPDTDYNTYDVSTTGSRSTFHMGNAVKMAAAEAKGKLFTIASELLEANQEDLDCREGRIFVKGASSKSLAVGEVIRRYYAGGGSILGTGCFHTKDGVSPDLETGQSPRPAAFWMYGAQAAEVEVDQETGQIKVLRIAAAHDVGKAINPLTCEGQIEGALAMGMGVTLTEEMILKEGRVLNANFHDYKIPTAMDVAEFIPIIVEAPHREGPFGAKGLGEPALAPTAAAIANAVFDAVGIRMKDQPLTQERVLSALRKKENDNK